MARLQERLRIEGYYEGEANGVFDQDLERALVDYQQTHQLWEADEVTAQTLRSLDIPAEHRWHQIRATLDRWRESRVGSDDHYIHVNIPDFYASIWRDGERKKRLKLIVGDTDKKRERGEVVYKNATPRFSEMMRYVVFNPYWNIPKRIRDKEVEPRFERELEELKEKDEEAEDLTLEEYVERKGYEYFTDDDGRERLRQKPGESNALGRVKFLFPNAHAVYMHDTPQKALFDRPFRAFSHGCIRLEEPMELAEYLLDVDGRWGEPEARKKRVDKWLERDDDVWVQLDDPLPVHIEYYVVRADAQGRAHFFSDLYDLDEKRLEQIAERVEELDSLGSQTARAD